MKGRPSKYTDDLANEICERLSNGESLSRITEDDHMPGYVTIFNWMNSGEHDEFLNNYARARDVHAERVFDELTVIADETPGKASEEVQAARLRIDTRKWVLGRMAPKKYSEKHMLELSGPDGGAIQHEHKADFTDLIGAFRGSD